MCSIEKAIKDALEYDEIKYTELKFQRVEDLYKQWLIDHEVDKYVRSHLDLRNVMQTIIDEEEDDAKNDKYKVVGMRITDEGKFGVEDATFQEIYENDQYWDEYYLVYYK